MEPENLLPHAQAPVTCPYREPAQTSLCALSHFLNINFNIPLYAWVLQVASFPQVSTPKPCVQLFIHATWTAHLDFIVRIIFGEQSKS